MSLFEHDNIRPAQMEVAPIVGGYQQPTMSSAEVAGLCEKRHDNVKRTIEMLAERQVIPFPQTEEKKTAGRPAVVYQLDKRSSLIVVAQLSPEFTARIVDRWQELEVQMMPASFQGITPETLEAIDRTFGISKMIAHKVTQIEKAVPDLVNALVQPLVMAQLAEGRMILRNGKTAKQIWDSAGLPGGIKGSAAWFGNRLTEMGCCTGKVEQASGAIRLFDPDKAALYLRNGLLQTARRYAEERRGQGRFRLHLV